MHQNFVGDANDELAFTWVSRGLEKIKEVAVQVSECDSVLSVTDLVRVSS